MAEQKELTMEERFAKLDEILEKLESKDATLEESFSLYQEGIEQVKGCNALMDTVEKKILQLNEDGSLEEFDTVDVE